MYRDIGTYTVCTRNDRYDSTVVSRKLAIIALGNTRRHSPARVRYERAHHKPEERPSRLEYLYGTYRRGFRAHLVGVLCSPGTLANSVGGKVRLTDVRIRRDRAAASLRSHADSEEFLPDHRRSKLMNIPYRKIK